VELRTCRRQSATSTIPKFVESFTQSSEFSIKTKQKKFSKRKPTTFTNCDIFDDKRTSLKFSRGHVITFDLLIGCDHKLWFITVVWFVEKYTSVLKLWTSAFWLYFCTNITHFYFYKIKSIFVTSDHTLFIFVYIINFIEIQLIHEIPRFIRTFSSSRTNFPSFIELISTCPDVENYHFQNYRFKSTSISYWFSPI